MKRAAIALLTVGLALAACSKPAATENSTTNDTLITSENVSDNLSDVGGNVAAPDAGNGSNTSL